MEITDQPNPVEPVQSHELPVGFVPVPTREYRTHRKAAQVLREPGHPRIVPAVTPPPQPPFPGSRVLMWKQDPSVAELGIRRVFLPGPILDGPRDSRVVITGINVVHKNALGDFIQNPDTEGFDAVHTFCVVRQTLSLFQRTLGGVPLPWQWNSGSDATPLSVFPRAGETPNAFYSRDEKALKFFFFTPQGSTQRIFTCRSLDIVAHETGHAILDALQPGWLLANNPPQTGGLHESFGDLAAIFLTLSQFDQIEAILAQTKCNLHDKSFLADMAEQFGLALGRSNGLRNADNDFTLSEVGNEVHAISQVFTGAIYDILADIFTLERQPGQRDDSVVLQSVGQYMCGLVLRAMMRAPAARATYADVANQMLQIVTADGKPAAYRDFIRNRFVVREVVTAAQPLTEALPMGQLLEAAVTDEPGVPQDRRGCCGTLAHEDVLGTKEALRVEEEELKKAFRKGSHKEGSPGSKPGAKA